MNKPPSLLVLVFFPCAIRIFTSLFCDGYEAFSNYCHCKIKQTPYCVKALNRLFLIQKLIDSYQSPNIQRKA